MATFKSIGEFDRALARMDAEVQKEARSTGTAMAEEARKAAYGVARGDLGGDLRFSGWPPEATLEVKPKQWGAALIPSRFSAGVWTVAEFGRNSEAGFGFGVRRNRTGNVRITRGGRVSRRRGRWNGVTRGKNTATEARSAMAKATNDIPNKRLRKTMSRYVDVN